jgi:capsule polysaccharide export protein KpsE/RkpR
VFSLVSSLVLLTVELVLAYYGVLMRGKYNSTTSCSIILRSNSSSSSSSSTLLGEIIVVAVGGSNSMTRYKYDTLLMMMVRWT